MGNFEWAKLIIANTTQQHTDGEEGKRAFAVDNHANGD